MIYFLWGHVFSLSFSFVLLEKFIGISTLCLLDIRLYWAVKMLFFDSLGRNSPKVNKLASTEEILRTTGFYKLPALPQWSQI